MCIESKPGYSTVVHTRPQHSKLFVFAMSAGPLCCVFSERKKEYTNIHCVMACGCTYVPKIMYGIWTTYGSRSTRKKHAKYVAKKSYSIVCLWHEFIFLCDANIWRTLKAGAFYHFIFFWLCWHRRWKRVYKICVGL